MNGCKYTLTNSKAGVTAALRAYIVGCTPGLKITIQTGICQLTVGEQSNLGHIGFANVAGATEHVTAQATVTGIQYEAHGALCGHEVTKPISGGVYNGQYTVKAFKDLGVEEVTEHEHKFPQIQRQQTVQYGPFAT